MKIRLMIWLHLLLGCLVGVLGVLRRDSSIGVFYEETRMVSSLMSSSTSSRRWPEYLAVLRHLIRGHKMRMDNSFVGALS